MTVIDYVDGVQVIDPATGKQERWCRGCAVEVISIGGGSILLQPASDADAHKCAECGKPIPIIRRNMPGHHYPGYDRVGDKRDNEAPE